MNEHWSPWLYAWPWTWPLLEMLHYLGLCLLLGGLLIIDLELMTRRLAFPLTTLELALRPVYLGLALNGVTGLLFFIGNPVFYATNVMFQIKMVLLLAAGLNGLYYHRRLRSCLLRATEQALPSRVRAVAVASLLLWAGVLVTGRLMPYF